MLKIRFSRAGRKKQPFFKIVVIPKSAPPTGSKFRDQVGTYDPVTKDVQIDHDKARAWIARGAQPSDTVHNLFIKYGVITGKKVKVHDKDPVEPEEEKIEEEMNIESSVKKEQKEEVKEEEVKEDKEKKEEENEKSDKEEKGKSLEDLDFGARINNALEEAGIKSVEDLKGKTKEELAEIKGLGEKSIEAIMDEIK